MESEKPASQWWVICLCAQWCGVCGQWREAFDQVAANRTRIHFAWVDIEDEDEALGDVDVETFPTILIARDNQAVFFGPIQPSVAHLGRLIDNLVEQATGSTGVGQEANALLGRLKAGALLKM